MKSIAVLGYEQRDGEDPRHRAEESGWAAGHVAIVETHLEEILEAHQLGSLWAMPLFARHSSKVA
jgi:hypothetical protein